MILLSIILFIFTNLVRYEDLTDNTSVRNFKDYINYSNKILIPFTVVWVITTLVVWLFLNFNKF
jgi:hypothetical protein